MFADASGIFPFPLNGMHVMVGIVKGARPVVADVGRCWPRVANSRAMSGDACGTTAARLDVSAKKP